MPKLTEDQVQDSNFKTEHRNPFPPSFLDELTNIINRHSMEGASNTPDYILAQYIKDCLRAYERAIKKREVWHGRDPRSSRTRY